MTTQQEQWLPDDIALLAQHVAAEAVTAARTADLRGRRATRRRRSHVVAVATAAVLTAGVGAAAAFGWSARTGLFGEPGMTENDTSEWLYSGASDYDDVVRSLIPRDLPLPEGVSPEELVESQAALGRREPAMVQETGIRGTAVFWAMCHWQQVWLTADARADSPLAATAVTALRRLAERPELAAVDGGGVVERHRQLADAAARAERAPVAEDVRLNCAGWVR